MKSPSSDVNPNAADLNENNEPRMYPLYERGKPVRLTINALSRLRSYDEPTVCETMSEEHQSEWASAMNRKISRLEKWAVGRGCPDRVTRVLYTQSLC